MIYNVAEKAHNFGFIVFSKQVIQKSLLQSKISY